MTSPQSLNIRPAQPDDLGKIRALYASVWGYNRPSQFDQWRFFSLPGGPIPAALAEDGERLAGSYSLWPTDVRINGAVLKGAQSMDTMTHPEYQGQRVFTRLAEACYEIAADRRYQVLYGFPNPLSYPGFVKRLGWTHTGDVTHWIRLLKPSLHPKVPARAGGIADAATRLAPKGSSRGFEIKHAKPGPEELQPLLDHWKNITGRCQMERSSDWLNWRYAGEAENQYRWISAYKKGALVATGAWGKKSTAWESVADNRAHLVELLGEDPAGLKAVLAEIISEATADNSILLETLTNIGRIEKALRRAGFYRHRQAPLIIKGLGDTSLNTDILAHKNWCIMGGDVDTF